MEREWERWLIRINTDVEAALAIAKGNQSQRMQILAEQEKNVQSCLLYITTMASEFRQHIPLEGRLSYRISLPQNAPESWGGIIGKIISDTATSKVLG